MDLFTRLLRLHTSPVPKEDFFSEIIAYLFQTHPEILKNWLKAFDLHNNPDNCETTVITQYFHLPLESQEKGSRFDILIEISDDNGCEWVVIESKLGTGEGPEQLKKYADILHARQDIHKKSLVYMTLNYDPKEPNNIIMDSQVNFVQRRWQDFYRFLKTQPESPIQNEIVHFMESNNMAEPPQFVPTDIETLTNLVNVFDIMDATLSGEIETHFQQHFNSAYIGRKNRFEQLRHHRYLLVSWLDSCHLWCGLGYFFHPIYEGNIPRLGMNLQMSPTCKHRAETIIAMNDFIYNNPDWSGYSLNKATAWAGIVKQQNLRDVIDVDNNLVEIKNIFRGLIDELAGFKCQYPNLPWPT